MEVQDCKFSCHAHLPPPRRASGAAGTLSIRLLYNIGQMQQARKNPKKNAKSPALSVLVKEFGCCSRV